MFKLPSLLSHCWLGDRKSIWPLKTGPIHLLVAFQDPFEGTILDYRYSEAVMQLHHLQLH